MLKIIFYDKISRQTNSLLQANIEFNMTFGFEFGISLFSERRQAFLGGMNIEGSFQERIQELKNKIKTQSGHKPLIVILGAGPAGLLRAIQSISNGNPTKVIEKRPEDAPGRINTVALTKHTIAMLRYCGIYQYLIENNLIYPPNQGDYISVRLTDLERAMKEVLSRLSSDPIIQYNSTVAKVDSQSNKIALLVESTTGIKNTLSEIDILVNAEGARSTTNSLLGIKRLEVLPPIPAIVAIYKDTRTQINGLSSLLKYVGKSIIDIAATIYFHTQFLFKFILSESFRKQINGALILKTPNQSYIGCVFSNEINEHLDYLQKTIEEKKAVLKTNLSQQELKKHQKAMSLAEEAYQSFAKKWIHFSVCHANLIAVIRRFNKEIHLSLGGHRSFHKFERIQIGADHADTYCKSINKTTILLTGDASATVDPTTGLGCNTALQSSVDFLDFIWDYDAKIPDEQRIKNYENKMETRIAYILEHSALIRNLYSNEPKKITPYSISVNAALNRCIQQLKY